MRTTPGFPARALAATLFTLLCVSLAVPVAAQAPSCPVPGATGQIAFPDGSVAARTKLEVNPDGAAGSYVPGDHGFTYIANGVNLIDKGTKVSCSSGDPGRCRREWIRAESSGFGPGTAEFCVFAMEVEPFTPNGTLHSCEGDSSRAIAGNGKGRPRLGSPIASASGQPVAPYLSTTSLKHMRSGVASYVDSAAIPGLVAPRNRPDLIGAIAFVRYGDRGVFAIVNDTGPALGEGTIALHQALRTGQVGPAQAVGPIPLSMRCTAVETDLRPPFVSRTDIAGDACKPGRKVTGASDIRAYVGIDRVDLVVLAKVRPEMKTPRLVATELTPAMLESTAASAGYGRDKVNALIDCLR